MCAPKPSPSSLSGRSLPLTLRCLGCGRELPNEKYLIHCPACGPDALLRTQYPRPAGAFPAGDARELASYAHALPCGIPFARRAPVAACHRAPQLAKQLGLDSLWVLLSVWAPQLGATVATGTFKEFEAHGVLARVREQTDKTLIISSAGNAGRAFLDVASEMGWPTVVVVPENALGAMHAAKPSPGRQAPFLLAIRNGYYPEAIRMVGQIEHALSDQLVREHGCHNVARRDALSLPFHMATQTMGHLPDHYVQAVGSGTGAIAAWEAKERLVAWGCFEDRPMRLHLAQNAPFSPMADAWREDRETVPRLDARLVAEQLSETLAKTLSNAAPPYSIRGGVRDALLATSGSMHAVNNEEILDALSMLRAQFNIDALPEGAAALAGLRRAVAEGRVAKGESVLLHITGGGLRAWADDKGLEPYTPSATLKPEESQLAIKLVRQYLEQMADLRTKS